MFKNSLLKSGWWDFFKRRQEFCLIDQVDFRDRGHYDDTKMK